MVEKLQMEIPLEKQMDILSEVASPLVVLAELIKNSYDEKAKNISIHIDTKNRTIEVTDDGRGFTEDTIKTLSKPGESYKKKDNMYNPHGKFFAGSMGIGLLSVFSIAQELEIKTKGSDGSFVINGNSLALYYNRIEDSIVDDGTKLILKEVNDADLRVLIEDIKNDKLKHISIKNYLEDYKLFDLEVDIDGITQSIDSPTAEELYKMSLCNFILKVNFSYSKRQRKLTYQVERTDSDIINTDPVIISFNEEVDISNILEKHYHIIQVTHEEEFIFLPHGADQVCDFEGTFYIREGVRGAKEIKKFGSAVRLYVNGFAMYNYLDRQNDWLQLAYLTQSIKNSSLKPNNIIGYIAFNHFNEYEEELQISKERSHFYNKSPYRAFYEIVYNIVVLLTFNIDVASRNKGSWKNYFDDDFLKGFNSKANEVATTKEEADQKKNNGSVIEPENKGNENKVEEKEEEKEKEKEKEKEADMPPPTISLKDEYTEPIILNIGTNFTPGQFVIAKDFSGEILKSTIIHNKSREVDINKEGSFVIKYSVTDKFNKSAFLEVNFIVTDPNKNNSNKPKKGKAVVDPAQAFYFTDEEIRTFSYPNGDLSRKIQQVISELHKLEFEKNPVAITALFRILIELCCRKACDALNITFNENSSLGPLVKQVLNRMSGKLPKDKISNALFNGDTLLDDKNIKEIRNFLNTLEEEELQKISKEVGEKSIIDILNLYIHKENPVTDDIVRYWHRMKPFLIACLRVPK